MGPHFGPFFQHNHRQVGIQLLQPDRRRQARGTSPHDDHVILHLFAHDVLCHDLPLKTLCLSLPELGPSVNATIETWRNERLLSGTLTARF